MSDQAKPPPKTTIQQTPVQRIAALENELEELRVRVEVLERVARDTNP